MLIKILWLFCLTFLFYSNNFAEEKVDGPPAGSSPVLISAQVSICPSSTTSNLHLKILFEFLDGDGDLDGGAVYFSDGRNQKQAVLSSSVAGVKKRVGLARVFGKKNGQRGSTPLTLWLRDKKGNCSGSLIIYFSRPFEIKKVLVSALGSA
jgi:hypothetical protein